MKGATFGYHAGGWGKPPVDENGKPLYGDVFGTMPQEAPVVIDDDEIDRTPWGELESDEESEESEVSLQINRLFVPLGIKTVKISLQISQQIELNQC